MTSKLEAEPSSPCQPMDESSDFSGIPKEIVEECILKRLDCQDLGNFRLMSKHCKAMTDEYVHNKWNIINSFIETLSISCEAHKDKLLTYRVDKTTKHFSEIADNSIFKAQAHVVMLNLSETLARLSEQELTELKRTCIDMLPRAFANLFELAELTKEVGLGTCPEEIEDSDIEMDFDTTTQVSDKYEDLSKRACALGAWDLFLRAHLKSSHIEDVLIEHGGEEPVDSPDDRLDAYLSMKNSAIRIDLIRSLQSYGIRFSCVTIKEAYSRNNLVLAYANNLLDIMEDAFGKNRPEVIDLKGTISLEKSARAFQSDHELYERLKQLFEDPASPAAKRRRISE